MPLSPQWHLQSSQSVLPHELEELLELELEEQLDPLLDELLELELEEELDDLELGSFHETSEQTEVENVSPEVLELDELLIFQMLLFLLL